MNAIEPLRVYERFDYGESAPSWSLTILGQAVPKGRGRIVKLGAHMGIKTPKRTRTWEDIVRQRATVEWKRYLLNDVPLRLDITFYRQIAKSCSRRGREEAIAGIRRPMGHPDLDNLVKSVTDGLNGVVYVDDALIVETQASKRYAMEPRVELTITLLSGTLPAVRELGERPF